MARQELVIEEKKIPIWIVLDEAVLRREMGPPDIMRSQCQVCGSGAVEVAQVRYTGSVELCLPGEVNSERHTAWFSRRR